MIVNMTANVSANLSAKLSASVSARESGNVSANLSANVSVNVSAIVSGTNIFTRAGIEEQAEAMWSSLAAQVKQDYGKEHFDVRVAQMKGYSDGGVR